MLNTPLKLIKRAETKLFQLFIKSQDIKNFFGENIFQGIVEANTVANTKRFVLIHRISGDTLDKTLSDRGDLLRSVRIQVDVMGVSYADATEGSEIIRNVAETEFPSCVDGDHYGTTQIGQNIWHIQSVDFILEEGA